MGGEVVAERLWGGPVTNLAKEAMARKQYLAGVVME